MREMMDVEIWSIAQTSQGNAILLRPKDLEIAVPVFIGQLETHSILIGKEGLSLSRPLTHDLFLNMLRRLKLSLERIEVHELRDNTFHARLIISGGEFSADYPLILDSRPSDALALAVREKCPMLIASTVIEQAGIPLDFFVEALTGADSSGMPPLEEEYISPETEKHRGLLEQLKEAVNAEEYERAAEIRDMLNLLDKEQGDGGLGQQFSI